MKRLQKDQRGITLVELLVAIPIAALVITAATGAVFQVLSSTRANNYMIAYREVQWAGYWVNHDAIQAQNVTDTWGGADDRGFPLTLTWTDWSDDEYRISYTLEDMPSGGLKYLQRQVWVNSTPTATNMTGQYIYMDADPSKPTNCVWDEDEKVLTFTIKAQRGQQMATRTYEIKPRPFS